MSAQQIKKIDKTYKIKLVIAGFIALSLSTGILINSVGQFILPIHRSMGYAVSSVSLGFSIICAGIIFSATAIARIIDKYSPRVCMMASTIILAVFSLLVSFTNELWQFYVCTIIIGLAFTGLHTLPVSVMLNNAFSDKRKGLAISIAFSGSGIGGMVFNPLLNKIIESFGWRMGFVAISIIYLIGGLIIVLLVKTPKNHMDKSEYMELDVNENAPVNPASEIDSTDLTYKEAIRTSAFWRLSIGMLILNGSGSATMMHTVPYMIDIDISPDKASYLFSVFLLFLAISKVIVGFVCDKIGVVKTTLIGVACFIVGDMLLLLLSISNFYYGLFLVIGGLGIASITVCNPIIISYLFGNSNYTRIFGTTIIFTGIGNSLYPFVLGFIFDITGNYYMGWMMISSLLIIVFIMYSMNFKNAPKQKRLH